MCHTQWLILNKIWTNYTQMNKGPKRPHIVNLSTMCHLCWHIGQGSHLGFLISPKTTNVVSEEKSKMYQPIRSRVSHLGIAIGPKNKLIRGRWDLASCQVSLNSDQWFQRRSRKCPSQSEERRSMYTHACVQGITQERPNFQTPCLLYPFDDSAL